MGSVNIRTKVIFGVALFVTLLFSIIQYQHSGTLNGLITQSEEARNKLLVETALPVLGLNLSFGLNDANRAYLEKIVADNADILVLLLQDADRRPLFRYVKPGAKTDMETAVVERSISDNITQHTIGYLHVAFSNAYVAKLKVQHQSVTLQFLLAFLLFLTLFIFLLNSAFTPLKELLTEVERFDPQHPDGVFKMTTRGDEVGIIQNAFAQMTDRIRGYNEEREELTRNLEVKVQERTLLLNEQKEVLLRANTKLEQQIATIREQEEMLISQSRLAAMGEMMSMIAHQWRQPLATMSLMIADYDVRSMMEAKERDERDRILKKISDTLGYMSDTVNDFQTYFKPNNAAEEAAVADVIDRAVHFTQVRLSLYKIEVEIRCDASIRLNTYVNELIQVLVNLINNAADAIRERQTERRWIGIDVSENGGEVRIGVSDSGGGIPEPIIDKVFEPYFSTKSKNGTGLGLYMAKMIVEKHGKGSIGAKNIEGGACFTLCFCKEPSKQSDVGVHSGAIVS